MRENSAELVPLKESTKDVLYDEMERLINLESTNPHPAIKRICRKKMDAILCLIGEQNERN